MTLEAEMISDDALGEVMSATLGDELEVLGLGFEEDMVGLVPRKGFTTKTDR